MHLKQTFVKFIENTTKDVSFLIPESDTSYNGTERLKFVGDFQTLNYPPPNGETRETNNEQAQLILVGNEMKVLLFNHSTFQNLSYPLPPPVRLFLRRYGTKK